MQARITRRGAVFVALLIGVVVAVTGATAGTEVTAPPSPLKSLEKQLKGKSPAAREQMLHSLAAKEGEVNVYTSLSSLITKPVQEQWAKAYPDVKLNLYRASSEDVTARVLSERDANKAGADVIETNGTNMLIFQHMKNVLVPYTQTPKRAAIPKKYRFDTWTADRLEKFVVAWNTNLVKDPPRTYADLADPKWKGKIAIEPTDVDWFAALELYYTQQRKPKMTVKAFETMFKKIASNAQLIEGHTNQANLLAAGQIQVIVSGHAQSIEQLQAKKAPITFAPFVTPVIERPQGMGVAYRLQHKAAALLFYDWLLSPAGQQIMLANGVEPARIDFNDGAFASNPKTVEVDERPIVAHYKQWSKKFDQLLGVKG
jgi:iron(III) transport system substrate-binding protein